MPEQGTVIAVGPGRFDDNGNRQDIGVLEGQRVFFAKYNGAKIKLGGVEYLILAERDLLAVFDD